MGLFAATATVAAMVLTGLPAPASGGAGGATTVRVSVSTTGAQGDHYADGPALSGDGRFVAFHASSANLVPGDTNGVEDVFVRDRRTGVTRLVSVASRGVSSSEPSISADGRFVAYHTSSAEVLVHDLRSRTTRRISARGGWPSISPDGRFVAFHSTAANGSSDVFLHDLRLRTTRRVSVPGSPATGQSEHAAVSAGGRYVAFWSTAPNLVPGDTNGLADIFVRDVRAGVTTRVSVSSAGAQAVSGTPIFGSSYPGISADGRWVTFVSGASNLVRGDTNGVEDAFVHDRRRGTTTRISVSTRGVQADGYSYQTKINSTGRYVVFGSAAANLVPGDTNAEQDIFVHDLRTGRTTRENVSTGGGQANNMTVEPAISADGKHVGFTSWANNLVPGDTNDGADVFVRDRR